MDFMNSAVLMNFVGIRSTMKLAYSYYISVTLVFFNYDIGLSFYVLFPNKFKSWKYAKSNGRCQDTACCIWSCPVYVWEQSYDWLGLTSILSINFHIWTLSHFELNLFNITFIIRTTAASFLLFSFRTCENSKNCWFQFFNINFLDTVVFVPYWLPWSWTLNEKKFY